MNFFAREHITEYPVYGYRPGESYKGVENNIDIVVAKAEHINYGKKLNKHVALQIIPPRIVRCKEPSIFILVAALKKIQKIF